MYDMKAATNRAANTPTPDTYPAEHDSGGGQQALTDQFAASLGPSGVDDVLDSACTLIYTCMQWLRMAYEDHDEDVIEYVGIGTFI